MRARAFDRLRGGAISVLIASALALHACSKEGSALPGGKTKADQAGVPVVTAQAVRKIMPAKLQAIGNVEPRTSVAVKSRIDGQIVAVRFRDGQDVGKDQLLFQLDPRALDAQVKQLEATVQRDKVLLTNAQARERRFAELLEKNFISQDAYTQVKTEMEAAQASLQADAAALENARVQLSYTRILSPISGRAGRVMIQVGNVVKANDMPLVTINEIAPVYVSFAVPERYLSEIRGFMASGKLPVQAVLQDAPGAVTSGELTFVDNAVDQQTGTIRLRATFPNHDRALWPGQFVSVTLVLRQQRDAIVVPTQALQNGPHGQYVYVVKPDMSAEMRSVTVDRTDGSEAIIANGIQDGETVVTSGQIRVTPGAKVAPKAG
jgi:multidrug efflux system membrane fusion protein